MLTSFLKALWEKKARKTSGESQWLMLVTTLQCEGRYAEAARICRERLDSKPEDAEALEALAAALLGSGLTREGLTCLERAAEIAPHTASIQANLGAIYAATANAHKAIESYRRALALRPDSRNTWHRLVTLLNVTARYDEAEDCCHEAIAVLGADSVSQHALATALFEQGRVEEAIAALRAALAAESDAAAVHGDLLRALNYVDGEDADAVFEEHRAWARRHAEPLTLRAARPANDHDAGRRLRVGYVSPYFRKHAVTFFLESVIEHHDRTRFDVLLYADVARPDEYSERLKAHGAQWRSTVGRGDEELARMVREDAVDILVDLSGHTPYNRLLAFARRPAPVQVTWNGYPNTTGMSSMDYRITDAWADPPGETERLHSERLVRLPNVYMSWRPPTDAPEPGPPPALSLGRVTFGSFNSSFKITPTVIRLWSRILSAVPTSRLKLLTVVSGRAQRMLIEQFAARGIGSDRLEFVGRLPHDAFLEAHRDVDIALDTFPYHGTTTTCFSLWMGVPVITLAGRTHVSRVGVSLLSNIGSAELIANDPDHYVHTAVRLADDLSGLRALRAALRERMLCSPLTDGAACARALEHAYRDMWTNWCESR